MSKYYKFLGSYVRQRTEIDLKQTGVISPEKDDLFKISEVPISGLNHGKPSHPGKGRRRCFYSRKGKLGGLQIVLGFLLFRVPEERKCFSFSSARLCYLKGVRASFWCFDSNWIFIIRFQPEKIILIFGNTYKCQILDHVILSASSQKNLYDFSQLF